MEDQLKEKFAQYQQLNEQLEQFQNFYSELVSKEADIMQVMQALDEIKTNKPGKKMLVPVASGIFLEAELKNVKEAVVNVGKDVCVRKSLDNTKEMLQKRMVEVMKHQGEVQSVIDQLTEVQTQLESELQTHV